MFKRKQANAPTSLNTVIFLGAMAALFGALLGIVSLVTQPVSETRLAPENPVAGVVYYIKGSESNSARWRNLRSQILQGSAGTLQISDGDLNSWAGSMLTPGELRSRPSVESGGTGTPPKLFGLKVNLSGVNFRMEDDQLQIGAYLEFPDLAPGTRFAYQVRGSFVSGSDGPRFKPSEGTLGRASIIGLPVVGGLLHRTLLANYEAAPEWQLLAENWSKVKSIELANGLVKMTLQ